MKDDEIIKIDVPYRVFSDAVLCALERDTGAMPIVPEILRILKIKMRKENIRNQRIANLRKNK